MTASGQEDNDPPASEMTNCATPGISPTAPRLSVVVGLTRRNSIHPSILQIELDRSVAEHRSDGEDTEILGSRTLTLVDGDVPGVFEEKEFVSDGSCTA